MVDKTWRNDWLKSKSVKHKIKTLADTSVNQCDHSAELAQEVGRLAKRALFKSVLNCCCTTPVTLSVPVPAQLPRDKTRTVWISSSVTKLYADSMWFVCPQLFFHCTLCPIGTVAGSYNCSTEDILLDLVFFSLFEELSLRTAGIME